MIKTYFEYIQRDIPYSKFGKGSLNGNYDLSFFLDYDEYKNPLMINVTDGENLIPIYNLKSEKRLLLAEHTMNKIQKADFISDIPSHFKLKEINVSVWLKENTNLEEVEEGKFLISEAFKDFGEIIPAKYLIID